jgi:hypothetical protein
MQIILHDSEASTVSCVQKFQKCSQCPKGHDDSFLGSSWHSFSGILATWGQNHCSVTEQQWTNWTPQFYTNIQGSSHKMWFCCTTTPYPRYSTDLAPSDYHLFEPHKKHPSGWHFMSDKEVYHEVQFWLIGLDTDYFCSGMGNLVKRRDKCLNKQRD